MECKSIQFSRHALQRMFERAVRPTEVSAAIDTGAVIENYPRDSPYPSVLLLAFVGDRPLHVVVGRNQETQDCIVVTVYIPSAGEWDPTFRKRKNP